MAMGKGMYSRCIAQAYDENHSRLAEFTVPMMDSWCRKNGWSHVVHRVYPGEESWDHNYRKYPLVQKLLPDYDVVAWMDLDVVPISGEDLVVGPENVHISIDRHGMCAGVVVYRSCPWTTCYVHGLTSIVPKNGLYRTHEQDVLKVVSSIGDAALHTRTIPETVVSNPLSTRELTAPSFYHAWSNGGVEQAIERIKLECSYRRAS
jgi:hypothetical protein